MEVFDSFNRVMATMKFTIEEEIDNKLSFLDITIAKEQDKLTFDIHRKPTTIDSIIPNDSCHPTEHKIAAVSNQQNEPVSPEYNQQR